MLRGIAAFEFRYQARSPLVIVTAALLFLVAFADMAGMKLLAIGGGNVLSNSPHAIIVWHLMVSMLFLFVGAAIVSNVIVRDDQTGFGPILRSTGIHRADYLFGRFIGAFAVGALVIAAATLGQWLGTFAPFADPSLLGPNRWVAFAYGYGLFALPNALIIASALFALATLTRSTAGTFIGVIVLFFVYLFSQRLMENQPRMTSLRVLADPFGMSAYMAASRYFTAAELNAGAIPVTPLMLLGRLLWGGIAMALLALTYHRFRFTERGLASRRQRRRQRQAATQAPAPAVSAHAPLPAPRFDRRTARAQFVARAAMEARYILRSPTFWILLVLAFAFTLAGLLGATGWMGVPIRPLTAVSVPIIQASFATVLVIIATYYGGELVWRERERGAHVIIDATPLPAWTLMLPKMLALAGVLLATLCTGMAVGLLAQAMAGLQPAPGEYLRLYLLPGAMDALLVAVLSVFVQALSPGKYAGWGVMVLFLAARFFGPSVGLEHPLLVYGGVPPVPLSDMTGTGVAGAAAAWFRVFWCSVALLLLIATHLLWPRGTDTRLRRRLRALPARLRGASAQLVLAAAFAGLAGGWIVYNTLVLNGFRTSDDTQRYLAQYEHRYFAYARLPQPVVRHVELDVALYPDEVRAEVRGRYRLVNETTSLIERVHVRLMNRGLELVDLDFPGARLERDDAAFGYRIYRLDAPMPPGDARTLAFRTRRERSGFRAADDETALAPDASDLNSLELMPRIGMSDVGLIEDPAVRRRYGLRGAAPLPRLDDLAATRTTPNGDLSWTTTDITVSTRADQTPVAPGRRVSEHVRNGRRSVRFVSDAPIRNYIAIQSGKYAVTRRTHAGVDYVIHTHPGHPWNVDRMMTAMQASIDYYGRAFGPYPFREARIVETPASRRDGGQAFPNTVLIGETIFAMDLRDPATLDMVSLLTAHEFAHQWWGQQVQGARMQGAGLLTETLAQYSALMVIKRLQGDAGIRRFLQFQRDRYLAGRRTQVLAEQPLVRVEPEQQYIAYGKGALALYLLQQRMGEDAVNRALRRFVGRYRFAGAPYPRSVDLVAMLRDEATTPAQQALITDLFERITLYDLKVEAPHAQRRRDGRWDVAVPVRAAKFHADGTGAEHEVPLGDAIEVGLFAAGPDSTAFDRRDVIRMQPQPLRSGRQVLRFVTRTRPTHAGIDPYGLYIDRDAADNAAPVTALTQGRPDVD